MEQQDIDRIKYLLNARPHTKEQGQEIVLLYKKYIDSGLTNGCSKCGGSLHTYLTKLNEKIRRLEIKSK